MMSQCGTHTLSATRYLQRHPEYAGEHEQRTAPTVLSASETLEAQRRSEEAHCEHLPNKDPLLPIRKKLCLSMLMTMAYPTPCNAHRISTPTQHSPSRDLTHPALERELQETRDSTNHTTAHPTTANPPACVSQTSSRGPPTTAATTNPKARARGCVGWITVGWSTM